MLKNAPPARLPDDAPTLDQSLGHIIHGAITAAGGWIGFDTFMSMALYSPRLGYYASGSAKFGTMPAGVKGEGSDFVTAPEMTPLFGQTLAAQVAQALQATDTTQVWEFGAGSGALALQVLGELVRLNVAIERYTIVDVSGSLRARQQQALQAFGDTVRWVDELPADMQGVVIGNEVLDAMPVKLLVRTEGVWCERGVAWADAPQGGGHPSFAWADRPTTLRPPLEINGPHDYLTEIHPQAEAFIQTLADKLTRGAAFFIDYGFPEAEYYHPQRHMGTVMCHQAHRADANPLHDVGLKDITAHVNFTGIALAGQDAGFEVLGYCTQARFLMNCGLLGKLENASFADKAMAQKLILEHEMGELFKVIAFCKGEPWEPIGFASGDRSHTL
jgi:SAM-dependent MidA family methyltransferase